MVFDMGMRWWGDWSYDDETKAKFAGSLSILVSSFGVYLKRHGCR